MHNAAMIVLCAGLASFVFAPSAALAQSHNSHTNSYTHTTHDAINPYVCDVDGDRSSNDYTSGLVNDSGHLVMRVSSFTNSETTYFCDNAGGFAQLSHPVSLNSISGWVKTSGEFTPSDVFVEIYVNGIPSVFYFNATTARMGPTVNGYTLYTWRAQDLAGINGFPDHPITSEFGFSINVYTVGSGSITGVTLNSHPVPFAAHTVLTCPFSSPSDCSS